MSDDLIGYEVRTVYDDGYKSEKRFENLSEAKSYFFNISAQDIEVSVLGEYREAENGSEEGVEWTEIARKEGKKK
ncbi:MAG: hypothetical protein FWG58_03870 [Methanomassiliicoccaceae archaeon]|nr:hypothetical protein [Methanomassiliicoccaceae archaeon]